MSQSLEVNIKTTSDVPQAMDKAKSATVSSVVYDSYQNESCRIIQSCRTTNVDQ